VELARRAQHYIGIMQESQAMRIANAVGKMLGG
jgi:hypothetical protein